MLLACKVIASIRQISEHSMKSFESPERPAAFRSLKMTALLRAGRAGSSVSCPPDEWWGVYTIRVERRSWLGVSQDGVLYDARSS